MPAVFVHGVPDTAAFWAPVLAELTRDDKVALALPGFGCPVPDGFGATKEEYVAWIEQQLRDIGEPVDLVGHDWGSLLTERIALTQPELLRSFTMANGAVTDAFTWHDLAVQWQTPEVGEQIMELMSGEVAVAAISDLGHPDAEAAIAAVDDTMKRCILALYRSAVDIAREWAPKGPVQCPGLYVGGATDPYAQPATAERFAAATGAQVVELDAGHWAPAERPREMAAALESFWAGVG
jgi:pimeloyl-ACP methyl ester carboxylesterase